MDISLLKAINSTLDCVEVKGRENMRHMLGCMDAIDSIIRSEETAQNNAHVNIVNGIQTDPVPENKNAQEVYNG